MLLHSLNEIVSNYVDYRGIQKKKNKVHKMSIDTVIENFI